jgi:hypothetical protein
MGDYELRNWEDGVEIENKREHKDQETQAKAFRTTHYHIPRDYEKFVCRHQAIWRVFMSL